MKKIYLLLVLISVLVACSVYSASAPASPLSSYTTGGNVVQISLLNQEPDPAQAGDTVDLNFKIENIGGGKIKNLEIQPIEDYPFSVANGPALQSIDNIDSYQSGNLYYVNLKYTVKVDKDAAEGQAVLKLQYRVNSDITKGSWITTNFSVDVTNKQFAQIIYIDKAKLEPGSETNITFTIFNLGNAPLQNMVFSWQEPTGAILPVYSGDSKYIKYLDIGQSITLEYTVIADVNAKPGLYQLNMNLKAESANNATPSVVSTRAGVFIGGVTDFDVAFSESTQGQTSLSVANTGNNPAQSVSVNIPQQDAFRVTGTNSAIIGNLDKGDYTLVSFQIVSTASMNFTGRQGGQNAGNQGTQNAIPRVRNASSNGNPNNLRVVIEYTDTTGERRSVEKTVLIQFRSLTQGTTTSGTSGFGSQRQQQSGFFGSTLFYILIGVLIVAGVIIFGKRSIREKIFKKKK